MILSIVRESGLSAWVMEAISSEGARDPTPALDRLRRYQEELAGALVDHLRGLAVPPKAARKWLQVTRGPADPSPAAVAEARQHLETFVRLVLPQVLHDPRELRE
jgi:hypothetical protein